MTEATRLDEIRKVAGAVSALAARCQGNIAVALRLPDGRILAPTTAPVDMMQLNEATAELRTLLDA